MFETDVRPRSRRECLRSKSGIQFWRSTFPTFVLNNSNTFPVFIIFLGIESVFRCPESSAVAQHLGNFAPNGPQSWSPLPDLRWRGNPKCFQRPSNSGRLIRATKKSKPYSLAKWRKFRLFYNHFSGDETATKFRAKPDRNFHCTGGFRSVAKSWNGFHF